MSDQAFKDDLLTWLHCRVEAIKVALKIEKEAHLVGILQGQMDSYLQVVAYIMSDGKLK